MKLLKNIKKPLLVILTKIVQIILFVVFFVIAICGTEFTAERTFTAFLTEDSLALAYVCIVSALGGAAFLIWGLISVYKRLYAILNDIAHFLKEK